MRRKTMSKKLIFGLAAATLTATTLLAAPAGQYVANNKFEGTRTGLNPYPAAAAKNISIVADAEKKSKVMRVVVPADKKGTTFYQSISLRTPGPGKIVLTLDYKMAKTVPGTKFSMQMNYNFPGKGNGSAGNTKTSYDVSTKWTTVTKEFNVPANTGAIQYVFGLSGSGSELLLDNIKGTYTPAAPAAK